MTHRLELTGGMTGYNWGAVPDPPGPAGCGDLYHPVHIHRHTFAPAGSGTRKDTLIALPGQQAPGGFSAANPGQWMTHGHKLYHALMAVLGCQAWAW